MRAVIYARFSCSKQREASIDDQLRVCRQWCEREGYTVINEYADHAISGRTDERPEFQRMIDNAGESDIVLVYMMDRFSRDAYDAPLYKKRLRDKGVRVVSAMEAIPDGAESILIEKLYEGLAAVESAHIAERTRRGLHGNALKAMHNGVKVFGYRFTDDGHYCVEPYEAEIVKEIFARHNNGEPSDSIARDLAKRGVKTYAGNPASYTFVANLLKNVKYKGTYKWGEVVMENAMPRIISDDEFDHAQRVQPKKRRSNEQWRDFPLAGKCVCMGCGHNFNGASGHGNGGRYDYYRCGHNCGVKPVRADWLESELVSALRDVLANRDNALEIANIVRESLGADDNATKRNKTQQRIDAANATIKNLTAAVGQGMPYADVKQELAAAHGTIEAATRELELLETTEMFNADDFADFLQFGATLDDAALLDAFIFQVQIGADDVVAILNYDNKKCEPATIEIARVRTNNVWLPKHQTKRTVGIAVIDGQILLHIRRAA